MDLHGDIAVDAQVIVCRVNSSTTNAHINGRNRQVAVGFHHQPVGSAVITLGHITAAEVKHAAAATDESHRRPKGSRTHVNGCVAVLSRTGMDGHRDLNILYIVLADEENTIIHIGRLGAATEVRNLEQFIDFRARVDGHRTGTGNVAIGIQATAIIDSDIAATLHLHKAHSAGGCGIVGSCTGSITMLGGQAQCTVDHQASTVSQGQRPVSSGSCISTGAAGGGSIQSIGIVKGDQQGDAGRNRVSTGRQRCVVHQHHILVASGRCTIHRRSEIIKQIGAGNIIVGCGGTHPTVLVLAGGSIAYHIHAIATVLGENSLQCQVCIFLQSKNRIGRHKRAVRCVDPTSEHIATGGSSSNTGCTRHCRGRSGSQNAIRSRNSTLCAVIGNVDRSRIGNRGQQNIREHPFITLTTPT